MPKKSRGQKHPFAIYRTDNSYLTYDITMEDYENLVKGYTDGGKPVETVVGFLTTHDIRAIIELKVEEKPKEAKPDKPALPPLSVEEMRYMKAIMSGVYELEEDEEVVN